MATEATTSPSAVAAARRKELTRSMVELAGMLPVLIVICILFAFLTPNFLTQNNIVNVVRQASINIVLAAGMTVAYIGLPPFIVTLGTYTAIRGAAYLAAGGTTVINSKIGFAWIGNGYVGPVPWLVIIALLTIAVSAFILHRTILGVHVYAVGGNAQAARLTGIPVPLILIFAYGVSGLLSGL